MSARVAIIAAFLLAVCGCGIDEGTVARRSFHEAYTWIWLMPMTMSTGKSSYTYFIPIPMYSPPAWSISVTAPDKNGKLRRDEWYIPHAMWDTLQIGASVCRSKECQKERASQRQEERR